MGEQDIIVALFNQIWVNIRRYSDYEWKVELSFLALFSAFFGSSLFGSTLIKKNQNMVTALSILVIFIAFIGISNILKCHFRYTEKFMELRIFESKIKSNIQDERIKEILDRYINIEPSIFKGFGTYGIFCISIIILSLFSIFQLWSKLSDNHLLLFISLFALFVIMLIIFFMTLFRMDCNLKEKVCIKETE